jgi:tight adherence protein B
MTPLVVALAIVLLGTISIGLAAVLVLWRPISAHVYKRADAFMRGAALTDAGHTDAVDASAITTAIARLFTIGMPRKWGVSSSPSALLLIGLGAGIGAWMATHFILSLPVTVSLALVAGAFWVTPNTLAQFEQGRSDKRFLDLFPDAIDMVVRMLRAGLPVSRAIRTVADQEPAPIDTVFRSIADQIEIGIALEDALTIGSEKIGLPDFRFFAAAVALQHTTGGNLVSTLEILADIVRKRRNVRMRARAITAEVRMSAYVLAALPFIVMVAVGIGNPAYMETLVSDPRGNVILFLTGFLLLLAYLSMRYLMRRVTHL